jgi:hypothetical protein
LEKEEKGEPALFFLNGSLKKLRSGRLFLELMIFYENLDGRNEC